MSEKYAEWGQSLLWTRNFRVEYAVLIVFASSHSEECLTRGRMVFKLVHPKPWVLTMKEGGHILLISKLRDDREGGTRSKF